MYEPYGMIQMRPETLASLDNIDRMCADMHQLTDTLGPLVRYLMPIRRSYGLRYYDRTLGEPSSLSIHLCIEDWERQYHYMMAKGWGSRVLGIDITWFTRMRRRSILGIPATTHGVA